MGENKSEEGTVTVEVSFLRTFLAAEIGKLFSQLEYGRAPAGYEIDYIVGGIVERGIDRPEGRRGERGDIP